MRTVALIAILIAAAAVVGAQEACGVEQCQGPLAELQGKLTAAEALLAAEQAKVAGFEQATSECHTEKGGLDSKLQAAQGEVAALQAQLAAAQQTAVTAEQQAASLKAAAEAAQAQAATCGTSTAALQEQAQAAEAAKQAAAAKLAAALADKDNAEARLLVAERALSEVKAQFEAAWLPHWVEVRSRSALQQAKPVLDQALSFSKAKAAELASVIDKHAGDKLPAVKAAVAAGVAKAQAVLQSEQVKQAKEGAAQLAAKAQQTSSLVVSELESGLITLLKKSPSSVPLARKPYVTYMAYAIVGAPLAALTLGLLGQLFGGRGSGSGEAPSASQASKGAKVAKRHKKRAA